MSRLIAFGCSYTFGHYLPDAVSTHGEPSSLAWPSILGKLLGRKTINCGKCGSSNKQILYEIQNFDFSKNDIVTILWTYPQRDCILGIDFVKQGLPNMMKREKWYSEKLKHGDFDGYHQMWTCMNYAKLYLDYLDIPNYHFIINLEYIKTPPSYNLVHIEDLDFETVAYSSPTGLDRTHPGKRSHKKIAKIMRDKLNAYNK